MTIRVRRFLLGVSLGRSMRLPAFEDNAQLGSHSTAYVPRALPRPDCSLDHATSHGQEWRRRSLFGVCDYLSGNFRFSFQQSHILQLSRGSTALFFRCLGPVARERAGPRHLGTLECRDQLIVTAAQAYFVEIVIMRFEVEASLFHQHRDAVARNLTRQQSNNLHLVERFLCCFAVGSPSPYAVL